MAYNRQQRPANQPAPGRANQANQPGLPGQAGQAGLTGATGFEFGHEFNQTPGAAGANQRARQAGNAKVPGTRRAPGDKA